jgi:carbamoyl-phosphate synthase small subunit
MRVLITDKNLDTKEGVKIIKETPFLRNHVMFVQNFSKNLNFCDVSIRGKKFKRKIVVIDCGAKRGIIRSVLSKDCDVCTVPYNASADGIINLRPDGVIISNGPGDPEDDIGTIETVRKLQGKIPIFGICLGHQIIALANGAKTYKMKFGHHGANHPVKNIKTSKIEITSQNHSYAVDIESLKGTGLSLTHINLLDNTAEGIENESQKIFSVQYHPESSPGPQDSLYLFDKFMDLI